MAGITDILSTIQNGVVAFNNLTIQMKGSFLNIFSQITSLQNGPLTSGNVATQADEETATSVNLAVTPGRQQFHPSAAKAWAIWTGSTGAILASYGITSITRTGAGAYTIVFSTAFSSANYAIAGMLTFTAGTSGFLEINTQSTTQVTLFAVSTATVLFDPTSAYLVCYGDQ